MKETVMLPQSRRDSTPSIRLLYCCTKSVPETEPEAKVGEIANTQKKHGGWKAMPFILGNETFERLATFGLLANFMVYLTTEFNMSQVSASNVISIWMGITNFAPLVGAFISDAYVGRFKTIAFASFGSLLGMLTLTMTAWNSHLHPPKCVTGSHPSSGQCVGPNANQLGVLITALGLLSVGTGGIRPCSIPFGIDQFDPTTDEGIKGINSFFNWYYATFTVAMMISLTVIVYIQTSISWVLGFGIPTLLMACSIVVFFIGTRIFVFVNPEGSIFSGIVQVIVAAYKKRKLKLPVEGEENVVFYDPPLKETVLSKLPLTNQFRFLNKAAMVMEDDLQPNGSRDKWRLSSIQEVEELKCIVKIIPIWACGIVGFTAMGQQNTFTVSQALKMDRHLGPKFQIPAGSITIISMITIGLWLPFYDRLIVPYLRRITKKEGGITLLQRTGVGIFCSILAMIVAGVIERKRRVSALLHPNAPLSVMWLAPQLIFVGLSEAFNILGQMELFNKEFPENMRCIANALLFCSIAAGSYLSTLVVNVVHRVTGGHGRPDWLANDINAGNLDYFYYLLAGMGLVNFVFFVYFARRYRYKCTVQLTEKTSLDVELSPVKE